MLIDTLSITSTCWSILYIKSSGYEVLRRIWRLACFDTIGKGMDTVHTRFDAIQNIRDILTLKIRRKKRITK